VEPITTSNQLLLWEAIDRVRNDVDAPRLPLEELTETTFTLVAEHLSLTQIIEAAEGLIELASHPTRPKQWGSPDFVDTDQGFTGVSIRAAMNCCSYSIGLR
jgi:hypothetical protein